MGEPRILAKCNQCGNEITIVKMESSNNELLLSIDSAFCECNKAAHRLTRALVAAYK